MKVDLRKSEDFLAGLLFILIGGLAIVIARNYPMGSAMRMGPGYFPTVLGGLLCLFGIYLFVRGVLSGGNTPALHTTPRWGGGEWSAAARCVARSC